MTQKSDGLYFDYEKIVSSEELPGFLFHYFDLYHQIPWVTDTGEKSFWQALAGTAQNYENRRLTLSFLDKLFLIFYVSKSFFLGFGQDKKKILFRPFKYSNIILGAKKYHNVGLIVHGKDRLVALKHGMGYIATSDLDQYLLAYSKEKDVKRLYELIGILEDRLKAAKPDYVVLWNDITPMERALALVSKKLGITTLEIHHGIFDEVIPMETGKVADYVLVWGKYFKDLYIQRYHRNPENIYILGYPYAIKKSQEAKKKNDKYLVCYLGQNFEVYNKGLMDVKIETVRKLCQICNALGLDFVYRPHPGDDRAFMEKSLAEVAFTPKEEQLEEVFARADIFIGFTSTALIEAGMRSKVSLQLMNYPLTSDNFEELGGCHKSLKTVGELGDYLKKIVATDNLDAFKVKFNNDYVETRHDPTGRFLEILKEIEQKSK